MRGFLIDTNVISELRKGDQADKGVQNWFASVDSRCIYLSVLVEGEIRRGIEFIRRRDPESGQRLETWLRQLQHDFGDRILPINDTIAEIWGGLGLEAPVPPIDGLLAATALFHDLTLITRNIKDFERTAVQRFNPFEG